VPLFGRRSKAERTRIFFTSDVHGSERCFLKFLNAARVYDAQVLVIGGDLTGKVMVPLLASGDGGYEADVFGERRIARDEAGTRELEHVVRMNGMYPHRMTRSEYELLAGDETLRQQTFQRVMLDNFDRWLALAEERLQGTGVRCLILPGNDDELDLDGVYAGHPGVINPEGQVVELAPGLEAIATGYVNRTPWNAPRDVSEEELSERIDAMVREMSDPAHGIFFFHAPPYNTPIDQAPLLNPDMSVRFAGAHQLMGPAGSQAVRRTIEAYQPIAALHGHIHESRGAHRLGRTLCINPGSEYSEGVLHGAIVDVADGALQTYKLLAG
jgi:Icc-related predicted phosphoesterase